jgi:hypothetical protein
LSRALGFDEPILGWNFEHIPNAIEGTNADVMWGISPQACVFCEVKLSEAEFGSTKTDDRHRKKLLTIYRPRLESLIANKFLEEKIFFKN